MKTKLKALCVLWFACSSVMQAQGTWQTFSKEKFKIQCGCKLEANTTYIRMLQNTDANIVGAYVCVENENNPNVAALVNINIFDLSDSYQNIAAANYASFENGFLTQYAKNLTDGGIKFQWVTFLGSSAIEYIFDQYGLPTKAIMFVKNKKSYLIQMGAQNNLNLKFNELKSTFQIL